MSEIAIKRIWEVSQPHFKKLGTYEQFKKAMHNEEQRNLFYNAASRVISNLGSREDFTNQMVGKGLFEEVASAPAAALWQFAEMFGRTGSTAEFLSGIDLPGDPQALKRYAQERYAHVAPTRDDPAAQFLRGGLEAAGVSALAFLPGLALYPVVGAYGAAISQATLFGAAEFDSFMDELAENLRAKGLDEQQIEEIKHDPEIKSLALSSAAVEAGFEAISNIVLLKAFKFIGKGAKDIASDPMKMGLKDTVKRLVSKYAKIAPVEMSTEAAQAFAERKLREQAGITGPTAGSEAIRSLLPAAGATFFMTGGAELLSRTVRPPYTTAKDADVKIDKNIVPEDLLKFTEGELVVDGSGKQAELVSLTSIREPSLYTLRDLKTGNTYKAGKNTIRKLVEPIRLTRATFKAKMLELPEINDEQADASLVILDRMASSVGMTSDEFIHKNIRGVSIGTDIEGGTATTLFQSTVPASLKGLQPVWYSPLLKALDKRQFGKAENAYDVKRWIENSNIAGIKAEMIWTGLDEFLDKNIKITKEQAIMHLLNNQFSIQTSTTQVKYGGIGQVPGPNSDYFNLVLSSSFVELQEGHFKNAIGWTLIDTRHDADGNKVMFLNELQSDYASMLNTITHEAQGLGFTNVPQILDKIKKVRSTFHEDMNEFERSEIASDLGILSEYLRAFEHDYIRKNWYKLVMKRAMLYAVNHGFNKIAWSTGEILAKKYGAIEMEPSTVSDEKGSVIFEASSIDDLIETLSEMGLAIKNSNPVKAKYLDEATTLIWNNQFDEAKKKLKQIGYTLMLNEPTESIYHKLYDNRITPFAKKFAKKFGGEYKGVKINVDATPDQSQPSFATFHSITITPDMKQPLSLFQSSPDTRGAVDFAADGRALIRMTQAADISTMIHEIWHVFEQNMTPEQIKRFEEAFGYNPAMALEERAIDKLERSARAFEKYWRTGVSPDPAIKHIFDMFKKWLVEIYKRIKGSPLDVRVSKEMREFFDSILIDDTLETGIKMNKDEVDISLAIKAAKDGEGFAGSSVMKRLIWLRDGLTKYFDVVGAWTRLGNSELGEAFKIGPSVQDAYEMHGKAVYGLISKSLNHDPNLIKTLIFAHEDDRVYDLLPDDKKELLKPALEAHDMYFKNAQAEREKRGISYGMGFIENLKLDINEKLGKAIMSGEQSQVDELLQDLNELEHLKFQHIPLVWFSKYYERDSVGARSILRYVTQYERKNWTIASLLELKDDKGNALIKLEDINLADIIMHYSRRLGSDIALSNQVIAAQSDKSGGRKHAINTGDPNAKNISTSERERRERVRAALAKRGWKSVPERAPAFKRFMVTEELARSIEEMTRYRDRSTWLERTLGWAKMMQFINPVFLPMYDLVQQTMRFGFSPIKGVKALALSYRARKAYEANPFDESPKSLSYQYRKAFTFGIASKPFPNPYGSFQEMIKVMGETSELKKVMALFKGKHFGINPLKGLYTLAWNMAWAGDQHVRVASYFRLLEKGYTMHDAAQEAALFHGDYASVPAKTRKILNKFFFTPTFKIVMAKLYGRMIRGAIDVTIKGEKNASKQAYALGLVYTTSMLAAFHGIMLMMGWESEEFGRKYYRKIITEEGEKELVWTFSHPMNLFTKYVYRVSQIMTDDTETVFDSALQKFKWEIHPVWRLLLDLKDNSNPMGEEIYNTFDTPVKKSAKMLSYYTRGIVILLNAPNKLLESMDTFGEEGKTNADKAFANIVLKDVFPREVSQSLSALTWLFSFKYLRSTHQKQAAFKIRRLYSQIRQTAREGNLTVKRLENFQTKLDKIIADLD